MYEEKSVKFENLPEEIQEYLSQQNVSPFAVFIIDNRRLYAARQAGVDVNSVWVTLEDLDLIDLVKRFSTITGGKSIDVR